MKPFFRSLMHPRRSRSSVSAAISSGISPRQHHPYSTPSANERYEPVQYIKTEADGSFVWKGKDRETSDWVTLRYIPVGHGVNVRVQREIHVRRTLLHQHIVRFREVVRIDRYFLAMVTDSASGPTLDQHAMETGPLSEAQSRRYFQQLVIIVDYCHKRDLYLRDLALNSFVLNADKDVVMLHKFLRCKRSGLDSCPKSVVGGCHYVCPDMLGRRGRTYKGGPVDVWKLGVCLYYLVYGRFPFEGNRNTERNYNQQTLWCIANEERVFQRFHEVRQRREEISERLTGLLRRLLDKNPANRITVREIKRDPWFLRDLPPNALNLNAGVALIDEKLISAFVGSVQSKDEVNAVLANAAIEPLRSPSASPNFNEPASP